jgi:hypothetical protein
LETKPAALIDVGWRRMRPSGVAATVALIENGTGTPFLSVPDCVSSPPSMPIVMFLIVACSPAKT